MQLEGMRLGSGEMGYCTDPSLPSQINRCTKELDRIGEQLPSTNPQPSPKFRKDVLKFCTDLRDFEKLFQSVEAAIDKGTVGSIHTAGPEDFARFAAQRQARLEAHAEQFRTTYLGKAVDYKNALVRLLYRNGIEVKEELMDQEPTALSKGWVRGADAVPAVADYLEKLLNLLPH